MLVNGDVYFKNWIVIYFDGCYVKFLLVYDIVFIKVYILNEFELVLKMVREKNWYLMSFVIFKIWSECIGVFYFVIKVYLEEVIEIVCCDWLEMLMKLLMNEDYKMMFCMYWL